MCGRSSHIQKFKKQDVEKMLMDNGFKIEECREISGFPLVDFPIMDKIPFSNAIKILGRAINKVAKSLSQNGYDVKLLVWDRESREKVKGGNEYKGYTICRHPDTMRCLQHQNLAHKLTLIAKSVNPRIIVIDGLYGLDRNGPMSRDQVKMDLIISSDNPVVADTFGALTMGFSPKKIKHIRIAEKEGLDTTTLELVRINKDWRQYKRQFHVKKTFIDRINILPFKSDFIARMVFKSSLTPLIYKVVNRLKSSEEKIEWDKK